MDLLRLDEKTFFQQCIQGYRSNFELYDIIRQAICYNVTCFLLRRLNLQNSFSINWDQPVMFAISESGWRGKIVNLKSIYTPGSSTAVITKDFVLDCAGFFAFCQTDDEPVMIYCDRKETESEFTWTERGERGTQISSQGHSFKHYQVHGTIQVPTDNVFRVAAATYRKLGMQIPIRELSCFALLLLEHSKQSAELSKEQLDIIELREQGTKLRQLRQLSSGIIKQNLTNDLVKQEPFWEWVNKLNARLGKE